MSDLRRAIAGFQVSQAIHVATVLGIPDLLADGPCGVDRLAEAAGADPPSLHRLLRALATVGVLHEDGDRRFSLTELGGQLRRDAPDSLAGWAVLIGQPYFWQSWGALLHSVRTGENAFRHVHGTDVWEYRRARPELAAGFDAAMTALTRRVDRALLDAYDFGRFGTIVDVGGNRGALLAAILREHANARGVLFDQAHVVAGAPALLEAGGVAERVRIEAGSFFDAVPEGGDAYLLKSIVHDWEDAEAESILRVVRRAMRREATLLVLERVLAPPNDGSEGKFSDLNMLVMPGGRERTLDEFAAIFGRAGFELVREIPSAAGTSVVEGRPVA
jgi:hypothetical protein